MDDQDQLQAAVGKLGESASRVLAAGSPVGPALTAAAQSDAVDQARLDRILGGRDAVHGIDPGSLRPVKVDSVESLRAFEAKGGTFPGFEAGGGRAGAEEGAGGVEGSGSPVPAPTGGPVARPAAPAPSAAVADPPPAPPNPPRRPDPSAILSAAAAGSGEGRSAMEPVPAPADAAGPSAGTPGAETGGPPSTAPASAAAPGGAGDMARVVGEIRDLLRRQFSAAANSGMPAPGVPKPGSDADESKPRTVFGQAQQWFGRTKLGKGLGRIGGGLRRAFGMKRAGRATRPDRPAAGLEARPGVVDVRVVGRAGEPGSPESPPVARPAPGGTAPPGPGGGGGGEGGGVVAELGQFALGLGTVTSALYDLGKKAVDFAYAQEQAQRKLAEFSPSQAANMAVLDAERAQRAMQRGEDTAGTGAQLTESLSKFEESLRPVQTSLDNLSNTVASEAMDFLSEIADGVSGVLEWLKKQYPELAQLLEGRKAPPPAGLQDLLERQKDVADQIQRDGEANLNKARQIFEREFNRRPPFGLP